MCWLAPRLGAVSELVLSTASLQSCCLLCTLMPHGVQFAAALLPGCRTAVLFADWPLLRLPPIHVPHPCNQQAPRSTGRPASAHLSTCGASGLQRRTTWKHSDPIAKPSAPHSMLCAAG